ncbi:transcriptional regulator domain-containing protein [Phenylobacterium sp.]|uniref:transcriptional regulator domain-containing protein n=1 Tax=Phenylobacterium sp. TaxID=1871053 RepID=UPI0027300DE0|nr:DUF6499 domain-containing protein [Phenylobacterium sp.]MDP1600263.1 DUF6499 domain-containing protein [Phenylobacterium sp.]
MEPDPSQWRSSISYDYFDDLGVPDLAWECLRRNVDYQHDYSKALKEMDDPEQANASFRLRWGLQFPCQPKPQRDRGADPLDSRGRPGKGPADCGAVCRLRGRAAAGA